MEKIEYFVWRMCFSYRALNKVTLPFQYPIGRCDDAIEDLGGGTGILYFIIVDCVQKYHQIRVWARDRHKLAFSAPDKKKYTFGGLPFGTGNAPPFYIAMIRRFQAERTQLFQLFCNNKLASITSYKSQPTPHIPSLQRSCDDSKFRIDN